MEAVDRTAVGYLTAGARLMEAAEGLDDEVRGPLERLGREFYYRGCGLLHSTTPRQGVGEPVEGVGPRGGVGRQD